MLKNHNPLACSWSALCSSNIWLRCSAAFQPFCLPLSQPFHVAEVFTGFPGKFVEINDTIKGFKELCSGKYDDIPEAAFYMVGTIDEALEKAKKMAAEVV